MRLPLLSNTFLFFPAVSCLQVLQFQSGPKGYSTEEWAVFNGKIPHLGAFTVCHWEKLRFFSERETYPWAFCYKNEDVFEDHHCTQFWYERHADSGGRYIVAHGGFGDNSDGGKFFN